MLALALRSPIVGTAIGGLLAVMLVGAFVIVLYRMSMKALDATNGVNPEDEGPGVRGRGPVKKTNSQSDV